MTQTKHTFGSTKALREHLIGLGFPSIRSTQTRGEFRGNGKVARWSMGLVSETGQSSKGAAASWGFFLTVEEVA